MPALESFDSIYYRACERKGGPESLESLMTTSLSESELSEYTDAELLSAMSKKVFQSGFVWRIVEQKWPQYEQAFFNFIPEKVLFLSPEQLQQRASDPNLIRHQKKTQAIYDNALMVHDIALAHGSFSEFVAKWPTEEIVALWQTLKKRGARLGGNTAGYFLRAIGKDTFLITQDIQGYLKAHHLLDAGITSQTGLKQTQVIFNTWQQQSGRTLADISRIVAFSVGDNRV